MITVPAQCHDDDWIDIQTASMILGVTPGYARFLARGGRLEMRTSPNQVREVSRVSVHEYLTKKSVKEGRTRRAHQLPEMTEVIHRATRAALGHKSGPGRPARLPLGPLWRYMEMAAGRPLDTSEVARRLQMGRSEVLRARSEGVTEWTADRLAVECDTHPAMVWGDDWWDTATEIELAESMSRHPSNRRIS